MLVIALCLLGVLAVRLAHLLIDRGGREHLQWRRQQYEYLAYIASLDEQGIVIRECANVVYSTRVRSRMTGITVFPMVCILVLLVAGGLFGWPADAVAVPSALLASALPAVERLVLRRAGHIDYLQAYSGPQRIILAAGAVLSTALAWAGFRALYRLAFGPHPWPADNAALGWLVALGGLLLSVSALTSATRFASSRAAPRFGRDTAPSSVLLLRSFSDDRLRMRTALNAGTLLSLVGARMSAERALAQMLLGDGELVAIGRPGERLPRLGAARTYFPDDEWQDAVRRTAAAAHAVVLICGTSAGLAWEVGHLKEEGLLAKTLFLLPPLPLRDAQARLNQLLNDLDLPPAAFDQANECVSSTVTAVRVLPSGRLAFYLCDGRDWAAYTGAVVYFLGELSGKVRPPEPGQLAAVFDAAGSRIQPT